MLESKAPFEQVFFDWYGGLASETRAADSAQALHYASPAFAPVHAAFAAHEAEPGIRLDHAYFAKKMPCTMLIDQVEDIWTPIAEADDWSRFHSRLVEIAEMREAYAVRPAG
jgi:serine/tyrosine/threonine adenylyltransferase